jgi:Zn-dependent peptidase ImmA (M78 family)
MRKIVSKLDNGDILINIADGEYVLPIDEAKMLNSLLSDVCSGKKKTASSYRAYSATEIVSHIAKVIPADLDKMAEKLRISASYWYGKLSNPLEIKIIKSFGSHDTHFIVHINGDDPETRRRFSLALAIAHFVLHRDIIEGDLIFNDTYQTTFDSCYCTHARNYASMILLPPKYVALEFKKNPNVEILAAKFKVTEEAMTIRLTQLGLNI